MQKVLLLMITAVIVSLDSFVAGFSVSLNKRRNMTLPATVALITLVLCLVTTFVGNALAGLLDDYVNYLSAAILVVLAGFNLFKKDDGNVSMQSLTISECMAMGVAVGMDASVANLSLAVDGYGVTAPIIFAVTHYFTVLLGQKLADKIKIPYCNVFSAVVLLVLSAIKFI